MILLYNFLFSKCSLCNNLLQNLFTMWDFSNRELSYLGIILNFVEIIPTFHFILCGS